MVYYRFRLLHMNQVGILETGLKPLQLLYNLQQWQCVCAALKELLALGDRPTLALPFTTARLSRVGFDPN